MTSYIPENQPNIISTLATVSTTFTTKANKADSKTSALSHLILAKSSQEDKLDLSTLTIKPKKSSTGMLILKCLATLCTGFLFGLY